MSVVRAPLSRLPPVTLGRFALPLRRARSPRPGAPAVLLLHGASAAADTFLAPSDGSLTDALVAAGFDVWLCDWRASLHVTGDARLRGHLTSFSCDEIAREDIPTILRHIARELRSERGSDEIPVVHVLGHCMGAACLAMAIGAGHLEALALEGIVRVERVILVAVGLFYQVSWDGWGKVQDRLLERVAADDTDCETLSPAPGPAGWPRALERAYAVWPRSWARAGDDDFVRRLAFLYGLPFLPDNLVDEMKDPAMLRRQFGAIPFRLYMHAAQSAYRGFVAPFDAEATLPPGARNAEIPALLATTYLRPAPFAALDVTLLTGASNLLWHRDSIDRMFEWLRRFKTPATCRKHVLTGYGHQDLWWGPRRATEVFPLVIRALAR